jgi:hypothetical protein
MRFALKILLLVACSLATSSFAICRQELIGYSLVALRNPEVRARFASRLEFFRGLLEVAHAVPRPTVPPHADSIPEEFWVSSAQQWSEAAEEALRTKLNGETINLFFVGVHPGDMNREQLITQVRVYELLLDLSQQATDHDKVSPGTVQELSRLTKQLRAYQLERQSLLRN